jgi:hypothetical protein
MDSGSMEEYYQLLPHGKNPISVEFNTERYFPQSSYIRSSENAAFSLHSHRVEQPVRLKHRAEATG